MIRLPEFSAVPAIRFAAAALLAFASFAVASARADAPTTPTVIAFVGDSMADGLWGASFRRLGKDKCLAEKVKLIRHGKNGTGLTRLDQFNWVDEIATLVDDSAPDLFVGWFRIHDPHPIV